MSTDPSAEQVAATGKAGIDALNTFAQTQLAALELVSALNFNAGKAVLEDGVNHATALLSVRSARDLLELNAAAAEPGFERALTYSRDMNSVAARARTEFFKLSEAHAVEMNRAVISILDGLSRTAPAGSAATVSAIKSALAASNAVYESYSTVARQPTDADENDIPGAIAAAQKRTGKRKAA